jgi:PAS domain S-box-containing protein
MLLLFNGENGPRDTVRFIEEKISLGLWILDLKTREMQWSPGFFRLLGLEPDSVEPSYALFETMIHPDDVHSPGELERLLNEAGPVERQFRLILNNRRVRYILNRGEVLLDWEGKPDTAIGVMADVTRQHEAQLGLDAVRQRYRRVIEAVPAIVLNVNPNGAVEDVSNWQNFTGQGLSRAVGYGWLDAVHPAEQQTVKRSWESAVAGRTEFGLEFRLRRADGTYRWIQTRVRPTVDPRGSISEWLAVCVDIHDQKLWSPPVVSPTITGAQLRAARGILNWSVRQLADAAGVAVSVIRRVEEIDGAPREFEQCFARIKHSLELAGVEFIFPPQGKPGVRPN